MPGSQVTSAESEVILSTISPSGASQGSVSVVKLSGPTIKSSLQTGWTYTSYVVPGSRFVKVTSGVPSTVSESLLSSGVKGCSPYQTIHSSASLFSVQLILAEWSSIS